MRTITARVTVCVFLSMILITNTVAQQKDTTQDIFQLSLEELMNIVVTPSKLPQFAGNVTQKIDVINLKEIETYISGNRNLCEAIAKLPGASVTVLSRNDANWGTYGGIGPKYSTYMLQGLPLDAFVDPMSLDLNAIDRIEVQRGPASVFYPNYLSQDFAGIQSPLAGTINLILKQKIEQPKTLFQTSYGSYNTLNGQIFHQNRIGRFNYFCGSTYEVSDYTKYDSQGSWLNMKKNPEYKKAKVYVGLTLFMDETEKQKLTVFCQETWHKGDAGRVYRGFDNQYGTLNAGYDVAFNDQLYLQSHIGIRSYDRTSQESNFGVIDTLKSDNGVHQTIIPVDISVAWRHGKENLLSAGVDYQSARYDTWSDPLTGYHIIGNKSSSMQGGIYTQEEWCPLHELVLRGGLRYAYVKNLIALVNSNAPNQSSKSWDKLLWSVGARYSMNDMAALYVNGGSSFATPGLKSSAGTILMSYFGVVGHDGQLPNPNLKPESGISVDGGLDFQLPAHMKVNVRGFFTSIQDAIVDNVVSQVPSQSQSTNTGSSNSTGGEIDVSQQINEMLSWFANGTYMMTNVKNDLNINENDVEIPFSPNIVVNLGASCETAFGLTSILSLNYNDGFYDGTSRTGRSFSRQGFVINTYIAQILTEGDSYAVECFFQFYNITNNKFEMPWGFKNPGFSSMGGLKITF